MIECVVFFVTDFFPLTQWSPTFLAAGTDLMDKFSSDWGRGGFGMIPAHYIYCALCFYYYYIMTYNEIIVPLTIVQNQWEPWACSPAPGWSHLGVTGDSDTPNVLLMSSLESRVGCCHCRKPCFPKMGYWKWKQAFQYFCAISGYSALTLIQNVWRFEVVSNILFRPPSFVISSSWSSSTDKVSSSGLFTAGWQIHSFSVWGSFMVGK